MNGDDLLPGWTEGAAKSAGEAYEGITLGAFEQAVQEFFATAAHPVLGLPYAKAGCQPMRELLDLLAAGRW